LDEPRHRRNHPAVTIEQAESFDAFCKRHPSYQSTSALDVLRRTEYGRLDAGGHAYLDYGGGGLYADSQLKAHRALLDSHVFGNPHSTNPTSSLATDLIEQTRRHVLSYFRASHDEYACIFTSNASHALKLIGESYPFSPPGRFLLTADNHNSVNGIREYARSRGASTTYVPLVLPEMRVPLESLMEEFDRTWPDTHNLFAYPAQSNFSGVQHPLEFIEVAHQRNWDVLLDASAYTPTNHLDLSIVKPDFVAQSFYKIFGYPTGLGCLLVRRPALAKLRRPWFAGGTVKLASAHADRHLLGDDETGFEDGTVDYLGIPAVDIGLRYIADIGVGNIRERVRCLTEWLLEHLSALKHSNGAPLVDLYGPRTMSARGATLAMNLRTPDGEIVSHREVERRALQERISLRTGCFCNPGAGETLMGRSARQINSCFSQHSEESPLNVDQYARCLALPGLGAVRVSLGLASNFADVVRFLRFARSFA